MGHLQLRFSYAPEKASIVMQHLPNLRKMPFYDFQHRPAHLCIRESSKDWVLPRMQNPPHALILVQSDELAYQNLHSVTNKQKEVSFEKTVRFHHLHASRPNFKRIWVAIGRFLS
ncbi:7879_t:CDS:1 [Funneliformis mosseae]|uniref:7879_t:CDS:1 n=1 Tax=Funneliformis mosseae TaxID=27381 RepID=A0A9N8VTY6_FUNMO|nr:7879_t:CDS:1 [Funneliformis mosseae]